MRLGCYPGSFNPLTTAHLSLAEQARLACRLDRVDLVLSRVALSKEHVERPRWQDRLAVLEDAAASRPWLGAAATDQQLLADLARDYDVLVVGADKWAQLLDVRFYGGSVRARDEALARLPDLAIAPRPGVSVKVPAGATVIVLPPEVEQASSTAVRAGDHRWMAPEAAAFDDRTGAWSDAARYQDWLAAGAPGSPRD